MFSTECVEIDIDNQIMNNQRQLEDYLSCVKVASETRFASAYPLPDDLEPFEETTAAMRYMISLGGGGKRIRSAIGLLVCEVCGGDRDAAWPYALAAEEIHTYTLILDDIQDASVVRRGEPACHIRFGTNTALLAAMRIYERGLYPFHQIGGSDAVAVRHMLDLLHQGQAADLGSASCTAEQLTIDRLHFIHGGKTSALIRLAILGGAHAAGATPGQKRALDGYGYNLGLAFQAKDDILSVISSSDALGKPAGAQVDAGRLTYPTALGTLAAAEAEAQRLAIKACSYLSTVCTRPHLLFDIADYAVGRSR